MDKLQQIINGHFSKVVLFLFIGLIGVNVAQAELKFAKTVIEDTIPPGSKSYPFEFSFENVGDATVEISEIKTTCGCTTAKLEKMSYAPGESGVIKGTFSVGNRQGLQQKKVSVLTKDLGQPQIQLALKLNIPQLVTMKPGLLLWRVGAEPEAKTLTISPNVALGAKVVSVECESDDFSVERVPSGEDSTEYEIVVAPVKTESTSRGLIKVMVAVADADPKTIYAHALIR